MAEAMNSECILENTETSAESREQRAESREQRAVRGAHRGGKTILQVVGEHRPVPGPQRQGEAPQQGSGVGRQVADGAQQEMGCWPEEEMTSRLCSLTQNLIQV